MNHDYIVKVFVVIDDLLKAMNCQDDVRTHSCAEDAKLIRQHRSMIETVDSQLEKMGLQRIHARSNAGIALKVLAALLVLTFTNL